MRAVRPGSDPEMDMMFVMALEDRLNGARILDWYDQWTSFWHLHPYAAETEEPIQAAIKDLHQANFELWHQEDKARDTRGGHAAIAGAKRAIDRINQRRNDQIEICDTLLLQELAGETLPNPQAELHSETPGQMLDRLSILSLKLFHTTEEIERTGAPAGHRKRNLERLAILDAQRSDLAVCLDRVWQRILGGELRFQVYRQLKMYNDPELNPALYQRSKP